MTTRWVDTDKKSRLTARGYEQTSEGHETFFSATPNPASLRTLLILAEHFHFSVMIGDCAQAFLQCPVGREG